MFYAIVAVIALIFDQLMKYWTAIKIEENVGEARFIPGFLHIANVHNTGAAFNFLPGARWFFVALCAVFVIAVIYVLARNIVSSRGARWAAVIVMTGAVGNCIDRIINGYVVDMLEFDFTIFGKRFPVFNIADLYITLGAIVFCIFMLLEKPKPKAAEDGADGPEAPAAPEENYDLRAPVELYDGETPPPPVRKPRRTVYTQPAAPEAPAAAPAVRTEEVRSDAADVGGNAAKTEQVVRMLVNGVSPAPAPQSAPAPAPEQPAAPAARPPQPGESKEAGYSLDDILAEFGDL